MKSLAALLTVVCLMVAAKEKDARPIAAADATAQIGKPAVFVVLTVQGAKDRLAKRGNIYLDSEDDFKDPKNLCVAIAAAAAAKFKKQGIVDLAGLCRGKVIRVRGCAMRFDERPYLLVHGPDQIEIEEARK